MTHAEWFEKASKLESEKAQFKAALELAKGDPGNRLGIRAKLARATIAHAEHRRNIFELTRHA